MRNMGRKFIDIDGVRYASNDGWWLIRASNTESSLISRCESMSAEGLERIQEDLSIFLPSTTRTSTCHSSEGGNPG